MGQQNQSNRRMGDLKKEIEKISDLALPRESGKKIIIIGDPLQEIPKMQIVNVERSEKSSHMHEMV
jgi:hypothetical protein